VGVLVIGATLIAIVTTVFLTTATEPSYAGRPLSYWLLATHTWREDEDAAARDAIRRTGTNAIPFLLRWLQYERPPGANVLESLVTRLGLNPVIWLPCSRREELADQVVIGFDALGTEAAPAIPDLGRIAAKSDYSTRNRARVSIYCLLAAAESMQPFAAHNRHSPLLASALVDPNTEVREQATNIIKNYPRLP
jgi:hypothetical protein